MINPNHQISCDHINLLLIEDDDIDASSFIRAMKFHGLANKVSRAYDCEEGLYMLKNNEIKDPYIILLDLNTPRMNGLEFLKYLRADPNLSHSVVFVLTTSKSEQDIVSAYRAHISGYLVKQFMDTDMSKVVDFLQHFWHTAEIPGA